MKRQLLMPGVILGLVTILACQPRLGLQERFISATALGKTDEVKRMLDEGGIEINSSAGGGPAISLAAYYGHRDIVELLLERQADANARDEYGVTPLMSAAMTGQTETAQLLLNSGADPRLTVLVQGGARSMTASEIANARGHPNVGALIEEFSKR